MMKRRRHTKRAGIPCAFGITLVSIFTALAISPAAEEMEGRTIQAYAGDLVTLPLEPAEGLWEHRIITPALISVTDRRQLAERVELVLSMMNIGTGRLEAVRIVSNRVVDRRYFFFQIEAKPAETALTNHAVTGPGGAKTKGGQQESGEQQDLAFALRMYEDGEYEAAVQALTLFRAKYPKSAELQQTALYEGQALYALKRYPDALTALRSVAQSGDERLRALAQLFIGETSSALGDTDGAIAACLSAFTPQYPDIDIRARTGLAVAYGRAGKGSLADEQFKRLFSLYASTREQNEGYLPALFHAASFYDFDALDAELAVKYYQDFLTLGNETLAKGEMNADARRRLRQEIAQAERRLVYIKRTYTDFK